MTAPKSPNLACTDAAELGSVFPPNRASAFREVQFDADAIGIVEEELRIAGARHDALPEFDAFRLQTLAYALDVGRCEGDVIKPTGILVLLLGAPHHDTLARLARAHQVHRGGAAGIEPVAGEIERRTIAVFQTQHVAVEILGSLKVRWFDGVVL